MAVFVLISYDLSGVQHLQFLKVRVLSESDFRWFYVIMYMCYISSLCVICGNSLITWYIIMWTIYFESFLKWSTSSRFTLVLKKSLKMKNVYLSIFLPWVLSCCWIASAHIQHPLHGQVLKVELQMPRLTRVIKLVVTTG